MLLERVPYNLVFLRVPGYLVLAHYIKEHLSWDRGRRLAVGTAMLLAGSAVTIYSYYIQAVPGVLLETPVLEVGWRFCSINVVCATAGAFLLFTCIKADRAPRLIESLSRLSYGIYLMHIFWLHLWTIVSMQMLHLPTSLSVQKTQNKWIATSLRSSQ